MRFPLRDRSFGFRRRLELRNRCLTQNCEARWQSQRELPSLVRLHRDREQNQTRRECSFVRVFVVSRRGRDERPLAGRVLPRLQLVEHPLDPNEHRVRASFPLDKLGGRFLRLTSERFLRRDEVRRCADVIGRKVGSGQDKAAWNCKASSPRRPNKVEELLNRLSHRTASDDAEVWLRLYRVNKKA